MSVVVLFYAVMDWCRRLLSTECASELSDLFDKSSLYSLDYNEDDNMLLQVWLLYFFHNVSI